MPRLNMARQYASSCHLQGYVYVFCGVNNGQKINLIERLSLELENLWKMIMPLEVELLPRSRPIVVPIDDQNIAIMGGKDKNDASMDDVIFFNV